uniref:Lipocalin n=1 Tax=Rhipicephalus zambeziensis TaxID=60191 RepID=A0A224YIA1_9ACAR
MMAIGPKGGQFNLVEYLVYTASDFSCGVIRVESRGSSHHELRVKNSSITSGPKPDCRTQFQHRRPQGKVIYAPYCQSIPKSKG